MGPSPVGVIGRPPRAGAAPGPPTAGTPAGTVPVLLYHAVEDDGSLIAVSTKQFAWQMRWLHEHGCQVVPLGRLVAALRSHQPLPPRTVVLTFDDGFASVYARAFPILVQYSFSATVFLVTGFCGQRNDWPAQPPGVPRLPLLSWAQVAEMDRHGIEFGSHTQSHPRLDRLPAAAVESEVAGSRAVIEERLGHAVDLFAYPYGRYDPISRSTVGRTYAGACTTRLGRVSCASDPLALERVDVTCLPPPLFRGVVSSWLTPYLGARRTLRQLAGIALRRTWR